MKIPVEFVLFFLMLLGIAIFHRHHLKIVIISLLSILIYKVYHVNTFHVLEHFNKEGIGLSNLFLLLLGFGILTKLFEESNVPMFIANFLPNGWHGGFVLLLLTFILSSFLDNIAAALIGLSIAQSVFYKKLHIGYVASIVACSNAGGAGSIIGDTTSTMMWISGVKPLEISKAYIAAIPCLMFVAVIASFIQDKHYPITKEHISSEHIYFKNLKIVLIMLVGLIIANLTIGYAAAGLWLTILLGTFYIKIPWFSIKQNLNNSFFLICLVFTASLMPIDSLPNPSNYSTLMLGFCSAVLDNIPLTKLAITQGHYDWGLLAYAVGFGGSLIWFGSSAGVAVCGEYPEGKSLFRWVKGAWFLPIGYLIGFVIYLLLT